VSLLNNRKSSDLKLLPVSLLLLLELMLILYFIHFIPFVSQLKDGTVKVWGWGAVGGMGSGRPGTSDINSVPLKVPHVANAVALKAGNGYGAALLKDGTIMGWGANMVKEGLYHQTWTPVKIAQVNLQDE
jgi:alpha-tubulin suppressor-like RCC1 family protein